MKLESYSKADDFLAVAGNVLRYDEVRYGLIYGIARRVAVNPHHYGKEDPWFGIVFDAAGICTLAWRTPPYLVGLAWNAGDVEASVSLLIESVHTRWKAIPGVSGHREAADPFAKEWSRVVGVPIQSTQAQRIYRLDSINSISETPGRLRLATVADRDLISDWMRAFGIDTNQVFNRDTAESELNRRLKEGEVYLWEDAGKPVSTAAKNRPTERGMAIGSVYTPPALRQHGYATSCVAGVCREILKSGYSFCTLYTDLSNPISNSIYMKIGFKSICDSVQHSFSSAK